MDHGPRLLWVAAVVLGGCGSSAAPSGSGGHDSGAPDAGGCVPGELADGTGACRAAGVGVGECGDGFENDDAGGCVAVLPEAACAKGAVALPGESACRPIATCPDGAWGDIPVNTPTQFVDHAFVGTSDGSEAGPWKTIGEAYVAAEPGATIAIAAGTYDGTST